MSTLRCERIYKSFGSLIALANITVAWPETGITALIGPNGAGKTTLVNVITGFLKPDSGDCLLGRESLVRLSPHKIARLGIGRSFQDVRLAHTLSVLDNILLAIPNPSDESLLRGIFRRRRPMTVVQTRDAAMRVLNGYGLADRAEKLAGSLSYGQQKLLALACCASMGTSIVFLDEPFAGVHPRMAEQLTTIMRQLDREGRRLVFIEHDLAVVRSLADHVIVMHQGRIIAEGIPSDVLDRPAVLDAYVG